MTAAEQLAELLAELGPAAPGLAEVRQDGAEPRWAIAYDDDLALALEFDGERQTLSMSAGLGKPAAEHAPAVLETLLVYSSLWRRTGVAAALDEPGGEPLLFCDLECREPTLPWLLAATENFAGKVRVWRAVVAAGAPGHALAEGADDSLRTTGLRV